MSGWTEILEESADSILAEMGETITYHGANVYGSGLYGSGLYGAQTGDRSISAVIDYVQDDRRLESVPRMIGPELRISVLNDSTDGIAASEWTAGDEVSLAPRVGDPVRKFKLVRIIAQDANMVTYSTR